jgi:Tfp pilus assembly protein PilN
MKLQFNLLPDVKQEYLKTQKTKRTVIAASTAASGIALFILLFMLLTVYAVNKKQLHDADKDINKYNSQLSSIKNIDKILTVQNQLKTLSGLHHDKHKLSRIFSYVPQVTPHNVCIGKITIDTTANTLTFEGTADTQKNINTFVDTLKFTKYKQNNQNTDSNAFPTVVESQFSINTTDTQNTKCEGKPAPATYQLTTHYDPVLFANAEVVELKVPQGLVTTRSVLDNPSNIFNGATAETSAKKQNNSSSSGAQ